MKITFTIRHFALRAGLIAGGLIVLLLTHDDKVRFVTRDTERVRRRHRSRPGRLRRLFLVAANGAGSSARRTFAAGRRGLVLWPWPTPRKPFGNSCMPWTPASSPSCCPATPGPAAWNYCGSAIAASASGTTKPSTGRRPLPRARREWPWDFTSGSTGEPKVIATAGDRLLAGIRAIHAAQDLDAAPSTAVVLPWPTPLPWRTRPCGPLSWSRNLHVSRAP